MYLALQSHTEQEQVVRALRGWQWVRKQHGSLYDRGMADSYYCRPAVAHYGGVGGNSGERVYVEDAESIAEYMQGYRDNEALGDHKDWG